MLRCAACKWPKFVMFPFVKWIIQPRVASIYLRQTKTSLMYAVLTDWRSKLVSPSNIKLTQPNCCYVSSLFEGTNFGCKNDTIKLTAIQYTDTAYYTWKIYRNNTLYRTFSDSINKLWTLTIADTGRFDVELEVISNGSRSVTRQKYFLTIVDCALPLQHTNANWYFGKYAGVKFRTNAVIRDVGPSIFNTPYQINTDEGSLSISTKRGQLLFYGGNDTSSKYKFLIYGKDYKELKGSPVYGDYSSNQAGIIIPYQKDTNKYHLFTFFAPNVLSNDTNSPKFYFHSVVDMGLQSTTPGEVTNKNQILLDSLGVGIEGHKSSHQCYSQM